MEVRAMLPDPREELHEVHVFHEARPALPRVPPDALIHPVNGLADQGVGAQRGEVQSCQRMWTFITMRLRERHVRLYHARREGS